MFKLKILYPLIALACLHLSSGGTLAQRRRTPTPQPAVESTQNAWKTYTSTEGRYSILMPGQPQKVGRVLQTAVGSIPSLWLTVKIGSTEYAVGYTDFPEALDDPAILKVAYDSGRDELLSDNKSKLVSDRDIHVEGYLGRQIITQANGRLFIARVVAVKKRYFQVIVVTDDYRKSTPAKIKLFDTTINKFLDSFKLIDGGATNSESVVEETPKNEVVDLGAMEDSAYVNKGLGFRVKLPETWHSLERQDNDAALQVGKELVKGSDKQTNEKIDRAISRTQLLFTFSKFPIQTPNVIQALLQCGVETLANKGMTSSAYLESSKVLLLNSPLGYKTLRDVYPETIAGMNFSVLDMELSASGRTVKQKYYATMRNGYALFFVATYFNENDRMALEKILQSVQFK